MINCSIPIVEIDKQDCVGDTVGKINYNSMALDTTVCNLSGYFYTNDINVVKVFNDLFYILSSYQELDLLRFYADDYKNDIKIAATTVNLLSSFWGNYQFSIQMPINGISLSANDLSIIAPKLSSVNNIQEVYNVATNKLKPLAQTHLNNNYPVKNYPAGTIINLSFFTYNLTPSINPSKETMETMPLSSNPDALVKVKYEPSTVYQYRMKTITATYNRDNVYLSTGIVLRFLANENKWNYIGYYLNPDTSTAQPHYNNIAIYPDTDENQKLASQSTTILGPCNEIKHNTWYFSKEYVYANALYTGTSTNLGSITLTLKTSENEIEQFTYKANGYNPTTNTGGTDVFLEINNNIINAYEQYPIKKTLVQSWISPFKDRTDVSFKFTFDNNGTAFSVCGSKSII